MMNMISVLLRWKLREHWLKFVTSLKYIGFDYLYFESLVASHPFVIALNNFSLSVAN